MCTAGSQGQEVHLLLACARCGARFAISVYSIIAFGLTVYSPS